MLVLSRRPGETVMIGNDMAVTVLGVIGNQVRLGFTVPKHIPVHREEIFERIQREHAAGHAINCECAECQSVANAEHMRASR